MNDYDLSTIGFISNYFDQINGRINCNISVTNNFRDPVVKGFLELSKTNIKINKLGLNYKDILLRLESDSNKIIIDTASIASNKGRINLSGYIGSTTNILKGNFDDNNIQLTSTNYELLNGNGINVFLDGSLNLYSKDNNTHLDGSLRIPQSKYLSPLPGAVENIAEWMPPY